MDAIDHYVVTLLPDLTRVQVGPMGLVCAQAMLADLKTTQRHQAAYNSWVDWRRLEQWPLLSFSQYRAEIAAEPARRTLPLGPLSDRILIEELKRRGYLVPKKSHVLNLTCQEAYPVHEYEAMARNSAWLDSTHRSLAGRMGQRLWQAGAFKVRAVAGDVGETILQMEGVVVAPEAR